MKEIDLSILLIDVQKQIAEGLRKVIGDKFVEKNWNDQKCFELFDDSDSGGDIAKRVDAFLGQSHTQLILKQDRKKL